MYLSLHCARGLVLAVAALDALSAFAQSPVLSASPESIVVTAGQPARFSLTATGALPLVFEWRRDNTPIAAAPSCTAYLLPSPSLADSGASFHAWVYNSYGNAVSTAATLTVNPRPPLSFADWAAAISDPTRRGPADAPFGDGVSNVVKYATGLPATLRADPGRLQAITPSVAGPGWGFRYTRARHTTGVAVVAERSLSLAAASWSPVAATCIADDGVIETWEVPIASASDARAFYRLRCTVVSNTPPQITAQPQSVAVEFGATATFGVAVAGTGPFTYQWRLNGASVPGATGSTLAVEDAGFAERNALISVVVRSEAGTVVSADATLGLQLRHPYVLFGADDLPELRARRMATPFQQAVWSSLVADAGSCPSPDPTAGQGTDIRVYAERLCTLGLVQLLDPTQGYNARFREYFFTMLRYANWDNPDNSFNNGDLTSSHFLTALALAYDWHFDQFSAEEKTEIQTRLARYTDTLLQGYYLRVRNPHDWTKLSTLLNNHSWINNGAPAAVALALAAELPESRWKPWLERTETNLANILSILPADGASPDGIAYHSYGLGHLILWLEMRDRAFRQSTLATNAHLRNAAASHLYGILPGGTDNYGGVAPFGDAPNRHYYSPRTLFAWLARRGADPYAQWAAQSLNWTSRAWPMLLWYDPAQPASPPDALPAWHLFPDKGIFTWRSSWANDATYFSIKCGTYEGGHEQPDAGHFVLERAGVPFLTDERYSYRKMTDAHNLLLVDGWGQTGEGAQWMPVQNPATRGRILACLADNAYFDLIADPTARYGTTVLTGWQREVVGFAPGLFVVRDRIQASASADFDLLLHSYRTAAPPNGNSDSVWLPYVSEDPWMEIAPGRWTVTARTGVPPLYSAELSAPGWAPVIEASLYVPEIKFDTGLYNGDFASYRKGARLRRRQRATDATSIQAFWFDDPGATATRLEVGGGEGIALFLAGGPDITVLWPAVGENATAGSLEANAAMAGRRRDRKAFFGRALTRLIDDAELLADSDAPIDLFARLEHVPEPANPAFARIESATAANIVLRCPNRPTALTVNGAARPVNWRDGLLSLNLSSGSTRIEVSFD